MPRVAVIQTRGTRLDEWPATLERVEGLLREAAARGAELIVLPECVWPAYWLGGRQAYFDARRAGMPGQDAFLDRVASIARAARAVICAGYVEQVEDKLFNSACLLGPDGDRLGVYRKSFLWDYDREWFEAGRRIAPIDTPLGPVGVMICSDNRMPEIPATLAARGARIIVQPTAWVNGGTADAWWNPQPDFLVAARAIEFGVPVASASKCGTEGRTRFVGSSMICDDMGCTVAQLDMRDEGVAVADVELGTPIRREVTEEQRRWLSGEERYVPPSAEVPDFEVSRDMEGRLIKMRAPGAGRPTGRFGDMMSFGGVQCGWLDGEAIAGYAPARVYALRGVHVVTVACGERCPSTPLLQARAAENRIFIITTGSRTDVFGPTGRILPRDSADAPLTLRTRDAAQKLLAAGTDTLAGREPALYEL